MREAFGRNPPLKNVTVPGPKDTSGRHHVFFDHDTTKIRALRNNKIARDSNRPFHIWLSARGNAVFRQFF